MENSWQKNLKKPYVVVEFTNEIDEGGKKIVDLVPSRWINTSGSVPMCYYPMRGISNNKLQTFIKEKTPPKAAWKKFAVRILQGASSYDQGLRRVDRSCVQSNIESTTGAESNPDTGNSGEEDEPLTEEEEDEKKEESEIDVDSQSDWSNSQDDEGAKRKDVAQEILQDPLPLTPKHKESGKKKRKQNTSDRTFQSQYANPGGSGTQPLKKKKDETHETIMSLEESNGFFDMLKSFIKNSLDNMEERMKATVKKEIKIAKTSILYDFKKRMDILAESLTSSGMETTVGKIEEAKKKLEIALPIASLETFTSFEQDIKADSGKEEAFKSLMQCLLRGSKTLIEGIKNCLPYIITKDVQLEYTATGRKVRGIGKADFRETHTYQTMASILSDMLEISPKDIVAKTSKWLSGAADREGGKKMRMSVQEGQ